MVLDCGQLHQAVGTILLVQVEHPEDQRESGEDTETDTEPPVNTYHIEDDEQQENGQQAPDKEVQVLCKPLNSTLRPIPLLILYSIVCYITGRRNEGLSPRR